MDSLFLAGALIAAMMAGVWTASVLVRNVGIIDAFWGLGFVVAAWTYYATTGGFPARKILTVALVTVWGLRLSVHLAIRNFGKPEDYRYGAMRARWGRRFTWVSLFSVFLPQAVLLWALSIPIWQAQRAPTPEHLGALDVLGAVVVVVGLIFEAVGDEQLRRFKADPANRGRVMEGGLWRYTRHPNYFGDAAVWWGLGLIALATPAALWTLYAPALMTLLLVRVSGVPLLEKKLAETRPGYREYIERTSSFMPWFPRRRGSAR
jgi:steroid 5-alpha reductase family enzyme